MTLRYTIVPSPVGELLLALDADGRLTRLHFVDERDGPRGRVHRPAPGWVEDPAALRGVVRQLDEYFDGRRTDFDVEVRLDGPPFHQAVWGALQTIPYGETISYGELARRIHSPKAVRAVGQANGANPVAIVVPCHRVIGANGRLTGYGGGLDRKRRLLDLEQGVAALV